MPLTNSDIPQGTMAPAQVAVPCIPQKSSSPILLILVVAVVAAIITGATVYLFQKELSNQQVAKLEQRIEDLESQKTNNLDSSGTTQQPPVTTSLQISNPDIAQLTEYLLFSKYTPVEATLISKLANGNSQYTFTKGQKTSNDVHNNYILAFPSSWSLFEYTNETNRDDHGTNLLLKKGDDYIRIKQQLYESGTCSFDGETKEQGMAIFCKLEKALAVSGRNWKVFTVPDSGVFVSGKKIAVMKYGVCDQDAYARGISTYATPTEYDKKLCSPWSQIGEIEFFSSSSNDQNYQEFLTIAKNIEVVELPN